MRNRPNFWRTAATCGLVLALAAPAAMAQGNSGNPPGGGTGNGSDRSGTPPGSTPPGGGFGRGGRNANASPVEGALTVTSVAVTQLGGALRSGSLAAPGGTRFSQGTQKVLLDLLTAGGDTDVESLVTALTAPANQGAQVHAHALAAKLHGLLLAPERLHEVVVAYNSFVDASSAEFLAKPSVEFLAVRAALSPLVSQAIAAAGR